MASDLRSRAGGGLAGTKRPQVEEQKAADPDTVTAADFRQARSPQAGQKRFVRATVAAPSVKQSGKRSTLATEKRMQSRRGFSIAPARIRTSYYTRRARQKKKQRTLSTPLSVNEGGLTLA